MGGRGHERSRGRRERPRVTKNLSRTRGGEASRHFVLTAPPLPRRQSFASRYMDHPRLSCPNRQPRVVSRLIVGTCIGKTLQVTILTIPNVLQRMTPTSHGLASSKRSRSDVLLHKNEVRLNTGIGGNEGQGTTKRHERHARAGRRRVQEEPKRLGDMASFEGGTGTRQQDKQTLEVDSLVR